MTKTYQLPYGKTSIAINLEESNVRVDLFLPIELHPEMDEKDQIVTAIRNPLNGHGFPIQINSSTTVAITINDKTRPVPNHLLYPPLLSKLEEIGVKRENISILIATGTHLPMPENEFSLLLPESVWRQYKIISHNCDEESNLTFKGTTSRGTPVFINSIFDRAEIKIVVGDIEPHHFAGFSGGYKSASIGVCGRQTINVNHAFLQDPKSCVGRYEDNPLRQDIEEIGRLIGVDLALNAILNEKKEILHVFFGSPMDVIAKGIKVIRENELTLIDEPYDLVIASAGGYPKDINLYQAQKALTHASLFCKDGGMVFLAAECVEGVGSQGYLDFMQGVNSHSEAKQKLNEMGFKVGPHKAFQFAALADRIQFEVKCGIDAETLKKILIHPIGDLNQAVKSYLLDQPATRVAVVPFATATIPKIRGEFHGD
jgi:lactate racemase